MSNETKKHPARGSCCPGKGGSVTYYDEIRAIAKKVEAEARHLRTIADAVPATQVTSRRETGTLSADEVGELVTAATRFMPQRSAEIVTMAFTGMRTGEPAQVDRCLEILEAAQEIERERDLLKARVAELEVEERSTTKLSTATLTNATEEVMAKKIDRLETKPIPPEEVKRIREDVLELSQRRLADLFSLSQAGVWKWEQEGLQTGPTIALLRLLEEWATRGMLDLDAVFKNRTESGIEGRPAAPQNE